MANLLPTNILHKTTRDVKVGKYFIPKNTTIVPQISTLFINEKVLKLKRINKFLKRFLIKLL